MTQIKPCPFCGNHTIQIALSKLSKEFYLYCSPYKRDRCCGAESGKFDTLEEAIENWNMRYGEMDIKKEILKKYHDILSFFITKAIKKEFPDEESKEKAMVLLDEIFKETEYATTKP